MHRGSTTSTAIDSQNWKRGRAASLCQVEVIIGHLVEEWAGEEQEQEQERSQGRSVASYWAHCARCGQIGADANSNVVVVVVFALALAFVDVIVLFVARLWCRLALERYQLVVRMPPYSGRVNQMK